MVDNSIVCGASLIFGSGRSGTTWVQDAVASTNNIATVFEPLHPRCVPGARRFANAFVPPDKENQLLQDFIGPFLSGDRKNAWTSVRAHPDMLLPPRDRLTNLRTLRDLRAYYVKLFRRWWDYRSRSGNARVVKFIRANLMAEWLIKTFEVPGILIVRHPCAVVSSVMRRSGDDWSVESIASLLDRYLGQEEIWRDLFDLDTEFLRRLRSIAEIQAAIWCIENAAFLAKGDSSPLPIFFYEELLDGNRATWKRLSTKLRLEMTPDDSVLGSPSQQASRASIDKATQVTSWRRTLTAEQLREVAAVLRFFGVTTYSVDSPLPLARVSD